MLSVSGQNCSSATLDLSSNDSVVEGVISLNCTSSLEDTSLLLHHSVTITVNLVNITELVVQPLAAATNYNCCRNDNHFCTNVNTSECTSGPVEPLSPELAGVVGGFIGLVITLLLTAGIAGIVIGALMLLRRRK